MADYRTQTGVTLIELMVTIAVLAILMTLAAPSFAEFAERQALRGAVDGFAAAIAQAKEESIKRDQWVRVDFKSLGDGLCMGGATVATSTASTGCDCSSATACTIAQFPESERDLKRVTRNGQAVFGTDAGFVVDPRTGTLADLGDSGSFELQTGRGYGARVMVNGMGRVSFCTPSGKKALNGVAAC